MVLGCKFLDEKEVSGLLSKASTVLGGKMRKQLATQKLTHASKRSANSLVSRLGLDTENVSCAQNTQGYRYGE